MQICITISSTSSSIIENDISMLKKSVDCLGSTLSECAMNHTRLESMFRKKHTPPMHAHHTQHTQAPHIQTHNTMYAHVYTCTHCRRKGRLAKFCYDRYMIQILQIDLFGLGKELTLMNPKEYGYLLFYLM